MDGKTFVKELEASNEKLLSEMGKESALSVPAPKGDVTSLLKIALANELSVSELAAMWMPSTKDWKVKIALACQAGDEARHFQLVEKRLTAIGVDLSNFQSPPANPLFEFLRSLQFPVERIAAGSFTLEALAYRVNETFMSSCEILGDKETAEIYRRYIQPDELRHHELGGKLLEEYASTPEDQALAREASLKTLEIAKNLRSAAAKKLGTDCFPGC